MKSEPEVYSIDDLERDGTTDWTQVRNFKARNFMREMKAGERGFFYHSNDGKEVVGIVEVAAEIHPDSTTDDARWECVDLRAVMDMPKPVSLDAVKAEPRLKDMVLVNNSRLSVQPVSEAEFRLVCEMGGLDPDMAAKGAPKG